MNFKNGVQKFTFFSEKCVSLHFVTGIFNKKVIYMMLNIGL